MWRQEAPQTSWPFSGSRIRNCARPWKGEYGVLHPYHKWQFSILPPSRACGLFLFSCVLLEDSVTIRTYFLRTVFASPVVYRRARVLRAGVADSKEERKGAKVQGSRDTGGPLCICVNYPFALPLKEGEAEKNQGASISFLLLLQPYVILFVSASIAT